MEKEISLPIIMNTQEIADYLGISPFTVIKKAERGLIPAFKIGKLWRFRADDIEKWINEQQTIIKKRGK